MRSGSCIIRNIPLTWMSHISPIKFFTLLSVYTEGVLFNIVILCRLDGREPERPPPSAEVKNPSNCTSCLPSALMEWCLHKHWDVWTLSGFDVLLAVAIFWVLTLCILVQVHSRSKHLFSSLLASSWLLGLLFDSEEGGNIFLRNVSELYQTKRHHIP
jgi:hypothetical protein